MDDGVDGGRKRRGRGRRGNVWRWFCVGGRLVVIIGLLIIVVVGRAKEGKVYFAARSGGFCEKMNVGEKEAASSCGNGGRVEPRALPVDVNSVVADAKVVCSPVDEGINLGQPWFAQEEVVFLQGINNGSERCGVLLSLEGDVCKVGRKRL